MSTLPSDDVIGTVDEVPVDDLDRKLLDAFAGRVVRKDLVKRLKVGFNIPVYVLEYLLGKFCSTTHAEEITAGLQQVKETITERIVRADQGELVKARLQRQGAMRIIDLCTVTFDEKDQGGKYRARLAASGLDFVHVEPELVHRHERLFTGGIWANIELSYDETIVHRGVTWPFVVFGPEHAHTIAAGGFSKRDVQRFLFEHARNKVGILKLRAMYKAGDWPDWVDRDDDEALCPIVGAPEDIHIVVTGGPGKHSAFIPTFGTSKSVTRRIEPSRR